MCCGLLPPWDTTQVSPKDRRLANCSRHVDIHPCHTARILPVPSKSLVPCNASKPSSGIHLLLKSVLPAVHDLHRHPHSSVQRTASPAGDEVLAAAASHVHSILHQFNQQNLALTLWAFAKLAWCPPTDLLSDAASLAVASLHTSNSQNLSNTLWAFATLGFMPQAGLLEVCQAIASCFGMASLLVMSSASCPGCSCWNVTAIFCCAVGHSAAYCIALCTSNSVYCCKASCHS